MAPQEMLNLPPDRVYPDPFQPRQQFAGEELERMTASIRSRGILQPIRVRYDQERASYIIISGECRWRAAKMAGLASLPCLVVEGELDEGDKLADQIIENTIRNSLKASELARALAKLKALKGCNSQTLARELGLSGAAITRAESLLSLPEDVLDLVDSGALPESTAYEISRLPDEAGMRELAEAATVRKLSRSQVIEKVQAVVGQKSVRPKTSRVACRLDGGLQVIVSAKADVTAAMLKAVIEQLKIEAKRLEKSEPAPAALSAAAS